MADTQHFLVRFWGVRGSYPTPGPHTLRHGGNTACVEVQAGTHTLILDAGSGIIRLGSEPVQRKHGKALNISLLITHGSGDDLVGFPFFLPLFDPQANISIFGPRLADRGIEQLVTPLMSPPYFPVDVRTLPSCRTYHTLNNDEQIIWRQGAADPVVITKQENVQDIEVRVASMITNSHPKNGALIYRIEYASRYLIFATDVEWQERYDPAFVAFAEGADLLIHDAQYTSDDYQNAKQGFGHSTVDMATGVAPPPPPHKLVLFCYYTTYKDCKPNNIEK